VLPVLRIVGGEDQRLEEPLVETAPHHEDLRLVDCVSDGPLALLLRIPALRPLRPLVTELVKEVGCGHRGLVLLVAPRVAGELHDVAAPDAAKAPPPAIVVRIDGERGGPLLVVG
jgi:hypothetical protein